MFDEYVDRHGLEEIAEIFSQGVKIEVGDLLPSAPLCRAAQARAARLGQGVRGERAQDPAVRASCVEFVLAGLYSADQISRSQQHGRIVYEL